MDKEKVDTIAAHLARKVEEGRGGAVKEAAVINRAVTYPSKHDRSAKDYTDYLRLLSNAYTFQETASTRRLSDDDVDRIADAVVSRLDSPLRVTTAEIRRLAPELLRR